MNAVFFNELLLQLFLLGTVAVEFLRKTPPPSDTWISTYLTGPYSDVEDFAFLAMVAALEILPTTMNFHGLPAILFHVGGAALFVVLATRKWFTGLFSSFSSATVTRIHVVFSAIAFLATAGALFVVGNLRDRVILGVTALVCILLYETYKNTNGPQLSEKLGALGIYLVASLVVVGL